MIGLFIINGTSFTAGQNPSTWVDVPSDFSVNDHVDKVNAAIQARKKQKIATAV